MAIDDLLQALLSFPTRHAYATTRDIPVGILHTVDAVGVEWAVALVTFRIARSRPDRAVFPAPPVFTPTGSLLVLVSFFCAVVALTVARTSAAFTLRVTSPCIRGAVFVAPVRGTHTRSEGVAKRVTDALETVD
jgi:hypothetical protein